MDVLMTARPIRSIEETRGDTSEPNLVSFLSDLAEIVLENPKLAV
jgi:hypothetical protein